MILVPAKPADGNAGKGDQDDDEVDSDDCAGDGGFLPEHLFPFVGKLHDDVGDLIGGDGVRGGEE